jgi:hypothetical protein
LWVEQNFESEEVNAILAAMDWETWIYVSGLAPEPLDFTTAIANEASQLALDYIALNGQASPENYEIYNDFYSNLKVIFYDTL